MLKLYNTMSRSVEPFTPLSEGKVTFYHCGPTVYWTQHIGNLRGMTMGDLLVRTLRRFGYEVTHVRNYTDVGHLTSDSDTGEDKMEKGARREGLTPDEIAKKYIDIFEADTKAINLLEPTNKPRPSQLIGDILAMVQTLLDAGHAYTTDMAVYFDVSTFPTYTNLSHQKIDMNVKGAGKGEVEDPKKKHFSDFALWIFKTGSHANALQTWDSPFSSSLVEHGQGFPGWHIECSVMAKKYLGETIDIHMGGVEHIPIHHTNEIAQSEAANGVPFVHYWLHNEHLLVNDEKMAKSQGTGFSVSQVVEKGYIPLALRYFYLTANYRTRQNFTWEALSGAQTALNQLYDQVAKLKSQQESRMALSQEKLSKVDEFTKSFDAALEDNLNTPKALAVVWEVIKSNIPPGDKYDLLLSFDEVLGLNLASAAFPTPADESAPQDVQALVNERKNVRAAGDYKAADVLRDKISSLGYEVMDTKDGQVLKKK